MLLTDEQIAVVKAQAKLEPVPADHPFAADLTGRFGEHTFYLAQGGLYIAEPFGVEIRMRTLSCSFGSPSGSTRRRGSSSRRLPPNVSSMPSISRATCSFSCSRAVPACRPGSDIQVFGEGCVFLDELEACFRFRAHQCVDREADLAAIVIADLDA